MAIPEWLQNVMVDDFHTTVANRSAPSASGARNERNVGLEAAIIQGVHRGHRRSQVRGILNATYGVRMNILLCRRPMSVLDLVVDTRTRRGGSVTHMAYVSSRVYNSYALP